MYRARTAADVAMTSDSFRSRGWILPASFKVSVLIKALSHRKLYVYYARVSMQTFRELKGQLN